MSTNRTDDHIGNRFDPTARPTPPSQEPKTKTFEDGVLETVKILDFFKRNPHAHWVAVIQELPGVLHAACYDLCKFEGKRACQTRAGKCDGMAKTINSTKPGVVAFILCAYNYPAKNPLAMILPGWEVEEKKPDLTDRL